MVGMIYRAPEYSPNGNVPKDAAILEAVGQILQHRGHQVFYLPEERLGQCSAYAPVAVVTMARRWRSLLALQRIHQQGIPVLNLPNAVQVTVQSRSTTLELLQAEGLPVVPFWSYEPSQDQMFLCEPELQSLLPGWVKAMHPRGVTPGDVLRVETPLQADARVLELASQGYTDIIVTRHLEGPLLKLYVVGSQVWSNPTSFMAGGTLQTSCLPGSELYILAEAVARTLGLSVFGVDLILSPEGPFIIDVNDFPSFSSCREEAAQAIADRVLATIGQ